MIGITHDLGTYSTNKYDPTFGAIMIFYDYVHNLIFETVCLLKLDLTYFVDSYTRQLKF